MIEETGENCLPQLLGEGEGTSGSWKEHPQSCTGQNICGHCTPGHSPQAMGVFIGQGSPEKQDDRIDTGISMSMSVSISISISVYTERERERDLL